MKFVQLIYLKLLTTANSCFAKQLSMKISLLINRNYRCLKLTELVMKVLARIMDSLIRQLVSIDHSQFGFVPGRRTTDAIFVVRQLQEKYLAANKRQHGFCRLGEDF